VKPLLLPGALALAFAVALGTLASFAEDLADVPGAIEPESLPRIAGGIIIGYDQSGFDAVDLIAGEASFEGAEAVETVEGPRTRLIYVIPEDRSPLEVIRNYAAELDDQGFEVTYQCSRAACGTPAAMVNLLYPLGGKLSNLGQLTEYAFSFPRDDHQYLAARHPGTGRSVSIYAGFETFDLDPRTENKTLVLLDVIEGAGLERRMEVVTADAIATELADAGRISLYGILFDTDSDTIKPESQPTLDEIAAFMQGSDAAVFVVGHTDMTGGYDYNLDLSRRRAAAVVAALAGGHGIAPDRMAPAGVGPLAPVAENASEDGRARNRRVELVLR